MLDIEGTDLWYQKVYYDDDAYRLEVDNFEIMQYTGKKDINGIEIYEGDIVRNDQHLYLVRFGEFVDSDDFQEPAQGQTGFYIVDIRTDETFPFYSMMYKVVGNIYENLDLLED